jgi:hypothetical protein
MKFEFKYYHFQLYSNFQATTLLIDLYTLFTTINKPTRDDLLAGDEQPSTQVQDDITNVLEEEINLIHLSEKKSSKIARGEDDEDEGEEEDEEMPDVADLSPETRGAIHERRVCELAARMTLAVLGGTLPKTFSQTLLRHKGKVGQSYDKIILELGVEKPVEKSVAKKVEPAVVMEVEENVEVVSPMEDA